MQKALALAARGLGRTSPNPPVGCVLVREGRVVGEGFHAQAGGPHAEVVALRQAGAEARGATAYVTLEPCSHHGRTPPCAPALVAAGVRRVVVAALDPNPLVNGRGVQILRQAGLQVEVGLMEEEAERQQEVFRHWIRSRQPFVVYKYALTLDGRTATAGGDARWISAEEARAEVHRLRDELDAVVVGVGTVVRDDPALTCRLEAPAVPGRPPRDPVKVVLDSRGRTPPAARLFQPGPRGEPARVLILTTPQAPESWMEAVRRQGAQLEVLPADPQGRVDLEAALGHLAERGLIGLLLEGGGELAGSFFAAGRIHKVVAYLAPKLVGEGPGALAGVRLARMDQAVELEAVRFEPVGPNLRVEAYWPGCAPGGRSAC
ncbi:bifunctional diaminohydroxyphosphoribosylaminopyrimidine deaminase/5-amino-6-(5-phosphoribosylamino)uracil reductase RibD [Meiothermus sp. QL-1]|uniref:bifunctional diaminohydroxyphosphoribosylaminopyrimidine deaminase/5-amino-6-(5-phosphoribosylamino)uracil reductase RibD n=1 Tax=Meiothermus sp. QL-1 TaxID=2058095 RepID=UPI001EEC10A3